MPKHFITLDFESYYDQNCSITKLGTSQYVAHPDFQLNSVAVKNLKEETTYSIGGHAQVCTFINKLKQHKDSIVLCGHNLYFDAYILRYLFNFTPSFLIDTLCMAQNLHAHEGPLDLDTLAKHYLGTGKVEGVLAQWKGLNWEAATEEQRAELLHYNEVDVQRTEGIALPMIAQFPRSELEVIDLTLRMFVDPEIIIDAPLARQILEDEVATKAEASRNVGVPQGVLRSNAKFFDHLVESGYEPPEKWSEKQQKMIPAVAQGDLSFQRFYEDGDDTLQAILDARKVCKSAITETRAKALLARSNRPFPVGLMYCSAHTMRWGGTDKVNPQNMPRKGKLRHCLRADKGHTFVIVDASQIEARDNATFSEEKDLMASFAAGNDVYCEFATELYERPITKADWEERFVGKTCLAADSKVLTTRGWIRLINVRTNDKLWDGESWIEHDGVSYMGQKQTISLSGLELTEDHEILTAPSNWVRASKVLENASEFQSALSLATLPSSVTNSIFPDRVNTGDGDLYAHAVDVAAYSLTQQAVLEQVNQPRATHALRLNPVQRGTGSTKTPCLKMSTVLDCLTAWQPLSADAITQTTRPINTMACEVSRFVINGGTTKQASLGMLEHCKTGISRSLKWIGSTITEVINRAMLDSFRVRRTYLTRGKSKISKPVYDILNAGPNNRFTVLSNDGPIIVHNCILGLGFQMGALRYKDTLESGQMGPPMKITDQEAGRTVNLYRTKYPNIKRHWYILSQLIPAMLDNGERIEHRGVVFEPGGTILMPNGLRLHYPGLDFTVNEQYGSPDYFYHPFDKKYRKKVPKKIYGGMLLENLVQCRSRIMTTEHMLALSKHYRVVLMAHDEIVMHVPSSLSDRCLRDSIEVMSTPPKWNQDCPLAAEGLISDHYVKD